jgi:hypothetical protein
MKNVAYVAAIQFDLDLLRGRGCLNFDEHVAAADEFRPAGER